MQLQRVRESAEPGEFDFRGPAVAGRYARQEDAARLSRPRRDHVEQRRIEHLFETLGTEHRQRGVVDGQEDPVNADARERNRLGVEDAPEMCFDGRFVDTGDNGGSLKGC